MNNQEIFDTVATHLLKQKKRSAVDSNGLTMCKYRGPDGLKCAVGCLIPDDNYISSFENQSVSGLTIKGLLSEALGWEPTPEQRTLLERLQMVHDFDNPAGWVWPLKRVADAFGLNDKSLSFADPRIFARAS